MSIDVLLIYPPIRLTTSLITYATVTVSEESDRKAKKQLASGGLDAWLSFAAAIIFPYRNQCEANIYFEMLVRSDGG